MRSTLRALGVAVALSCAFVAVPTPVSAADRGILLDVGWFSDGGGVPGGFTGSSDFGRDCEYNRYSTGGEHYQHVYSEWNDTCPDGTHTYGSPKAGDTSIYQRFGVTMVQGEPQYYKAWAIGKLVNPRFARAQVKIIFRNGTEAIGECYGYTESTSFQTYHAGPETYGNNGHPAPSMSADGGCKAPSTTTEVVVHFRIRSYEQHAWGKAVLSHLRFGRCWDSGSCSNVPAP